MLAQGTPLHVVSEILEHASIMITKDVYRHLVEGDRRADAASMTPGIVRPWIDCGGSQQHGRGPSTGR